MANYRVEAMRYLRYIIVYLCLFSIGGCGTVVPAINPTYKDNFEDAVFVQAVARNVYCELRQVVRDTYRNNKPPVYPWLKDWSAKIALTLTVDEKSGLNPSVQIIQPPAFTLGLGGSVSSESNRIFAVTWYVLFSDLINGQPNQGPGHQPGELFIEGDLRIAEALNSVLLIARDQGNVISHPYLNGGPLDSVTHHVYFEIDTSANLTPSWRYVNVTANTSGNFLTGARTRRDELLITMGPTQDVSAGRTLAAVKVPALTVVNQFNTEQIGSAVRNSLSR